MEGAPLTKARENQLVSGNDCNSDPTEDQTLSPCRTIPGCEEINAGDTTDCVNNHPQISIKEEIDLNSTKPLLERSLDLGEEQQAGKKNPNDRSDSTSVRFDGIILDVLNSTTIHVDWCPVLNNEAASGYKIRYAARDNSSYNEIFVTPGISSYTITGLRPNTEYDISVNAVDDRDSVIQTCGWVRQKTDELEEREVSKAPYLGIIVAAILLTVAVVVPLTVLFTTLFIMSLGWKKVVPELRQRVKLKSVIVTPVTLSKFITPRNPKISQQDGQGKKYEAPYLTAAAAIALLLVAVVVPITFLFLRNCGQCSPQGNDDNTELTNDKTTLDLPSSFRHRNDFTKNDPVSDYKTLTIAGEDPQKDDKVAQPFEKL